MRKAMVTAAGVALLVAPAQAGVFMDGNELHRWCEQSPDACAGYAFGVFDALKDHRGVSADHVCFPGDRVVVRQVTDVVAAYLQDHPAERHLAGHIVVMRALIEAWPCDED